MTDLGDISDLLKEGSVSDLDWLDVNEKDYRALDTLPKQNLDIAPDLEAMWAHEDKPATNYLVPNTGAPRTLSDLSEAHTPKSASVPQVAKVARFAIMQSTNANKIAHAITSRFDVGTIRAAKSALGPILQEKGLLGGYYIAASDFDGCNQAAQKVVAFTRKFAGGARFVLAKDKCQGCVHNAGGACGVFQKQLVTEVPYTEELAVAVENSQASQGKQASQGVGSPKARIQRALLAKDVRVVAVETPKPILNPAQQLRAVKATGKVHLPVVESQRASLAVADQVWVPPQPSGKVAATSAPSHHLSKTAFEVKALLQREMLRGRGEQDLLSALKLSFSVADLKATRSDWEPLFKEAGFFGTVYSTQTAFDDCHQGADFLAKHNASVKSIVAGGKCQGCIYNKLARCMLYGRPLVAKAEDALTSEVVQSVIWEHRLAGRLETGADKVVWGDTPKQALKEIYRQASIKPTVDTTRYVEQAFRGKDHGHVTAGLTKREIVKTASKYLNEGLYGTQLREALKRQFDPRDIVAAKQELKSVLAEQGLQGIFYVDPMVYGDYAKGCDEGARYHRARLVPYVKLGSGCESCVLQTRVGYCSKYNKPLVVEPPYTDKQAQQREILATGESTKADLGSLMHNSPSILAQFEMQAGVNELTLNPTTSKSTVTVELGGIEFDL